MEVLAWEVWGICERIGTDRFSEEDGTLLEGIADLLASLRTRSDRFREVRELFRKHPDLKMPAVYKPHYRELPFLK